MAATSSPSNKPTGRPSRRDEILAAAAKVISEKGFKEATVRDIGDAAGILSGSLYYHFDSKEQIVLDLLLPSVSRHLDEAKAIRKQASSETEALRELIRMTIFTTAENPHKTVILRNSGRAFEEFEILRPLSDIRKESLNLWLSVIKKGVKNGEFRDDIDPKIVVHGITDGILGAARWFISKPVAKPERIVDSLAEFYVSGLTQS